MLNRSDNQLATRLSTSINYHNSLVELSPKFLIGPGNRFPLNTGLVLDNCWRTGLPPLRRLLDQVEVEPRWIVLDSIYQVFWPRLFPNAGLIVRFADHPEHLGGFSGSLRKRWKSLACRSELIIAPTRQIAEFAESNEAKNVQVCPNGVEIDHFKRVSKARRRPKIDARITAVFVGAIAPWIDWNLLVETARITPEVRFRIIGTVDSSAKGSSVPSNLEVLGPRPYDEIPDQLSSADIALAPFDVAGHRDLMQGVSAIKIFEYLCAGLQVVATRWPQTEALSPFVHVTEQSAGHWQTAIRSALTTPKPGIPESQLQSWSWRSQLRPAIEFMLNRRIENPAA